MTSSAAPTKLPVSPEDLSARPGPPKLGHFFRTSLYFGAIGFGGGLSVLASIRTALVDRKHWVTEEDFDRNATVAQMLPGGASSNLLAALGLRFHGIYGALAGYLGFILPGTLCILALAWTYRRFGGVPQADALLAGFNAAVVGIIASITIKMVKTSIAHLWQMGIAAVALFLSLAGGASSGEVALMGIAAGLMLDLGYERARRLRLGLKKAPDPVALPNEGNPLPPTLLKSSALAAVFGLAAAGAVLHRAGADVELLQMGAVFFRTGLGAYGGGFATIPSLQAEVHAHGWLTDRQFADAVAVGKLTPGPVLLMATFVGFLQGGVLGALVATVAIMAAPFLVVVALSRWLEKLKGHRWVLAALRGLTPAVVGLMAAAALSLGRTTHSGAGLSIAVVVALTLGRFDINPVILLVAAGAVRVGLSHLGGF